MTAMNTQGAVPAVREPVVYQRLLAMETLPVETDLIVALSDINQRLCEAQELDALLEGTCEAIGTLLKADRVHLALKEPGSAGFGTVGYEWLSSESYLATLGGELPCEDDDEVMMDLVATPPPLAVLDPLGNPQLPEGPRKVYELMQVKSAMAGRLQYQGKVLGVLCVHQCDHIRQWSQKEATFLTVVLAQLSMAVANARMIKSLQAQHQELVGLHFKLEESHAALERQVAERTLQLSEANRELLGMVDELKKLDQLKSAFLDTISHELRTPINFITGFGSLLEDGAYGELPAPAQSAIGKIMTGADRLIHLVDDLLDQTKIERGHLRVLPEPFDYAALIRRLEAEIRPLVEARAHRLELALPEALPLLLADADRVHQVLRNLLSNAIKFTPDGGLIRLAVRLERDLVVTEVADTGIGIPEEARSRVFDRFYQVDHSRTRTYGGTGLGLSIVKGLVEAMGGAIEVESEVGDGTRFRFHLPAAEG
ncbi:MAG: ATP-binding protein [Candidatus Sericytochromatia bacterium]